MKFAITGSALDLFKISSSIALSTQLHALWKVGIVTSFWLLWKACNMATFKDHFTPIFISFRSLCQHIKEAEIFKVGIMRNSQSDLMILRRLNIVGSPKPTTVSCPVF